MERAARIANLWNWLPAFRTVAETEHLGTAARMLHVSSSALSRSVKQLEDALGEPLFAREKARLKLNRAGHELLAAVRDAMRRIDDGVAQLGASSTERVRVWGQGAWLELLVLPAIATFGTEGLHVIVDVIELPASDVPNALLRGDLDLAIGETFAEANGLVVELLGAVALALCRAAARNPAVAELPFAICIDGTDPWPAEVARRIAVRTRQLRAVIDECAVGRAQAVLPIVLAERHRLRVAAAPRFPAAPLYLARRRSLYQIPLDRVVGAIQRHAANLLSTTASR